MRVKDLRQGVGFGGFREGNSWTDPQTGIWQIEKDILGGQGAQAGGEQDCDIFWKPWGTVSVRIPEGWCLDEVGEVSDQVMEIRHQYVPRRATDSWAEVRQPRGHWPHCWQVPGGDHRGSSWGAAGGAVRAGTKVPWGLEGEPLSVQLGHPASWRYGSAAWDRT